MIKIFGKDENRTYGCNDFSKDKSMIIVPWFQIFAVLSKDGHLNTRVVSTCSLHSIAISTE